MLVSLESFSLLVRELCEDGKEVEAEKGFVEMSRRRHVMNIDSYRSILDEHLNRGKYLTKPILISIGSRFAV